MYTLYSGKFERSCVECLDPLGLHSNVGFLQAVFLQQVVHLQQMLPKVLRQQLDLGGKRRRQRYLYIYSFHFFTSILFYSLLISFCQIKNMGFLGLLFSFSFFTTMHTLLFLHVPPSPLFITSLSNY